MGAVIKVCFVVNEFPKLSETFVLDQILGLAERGFSVTIVTDKITGGRPDDERMRSLWDKVHIRLREDGVLSVLSRRATGRLRRVIILAADLLSDAQFNRFDVLIAHFGYNGSRLARSKLLGRFDPPFLTVFHGLDVGLPLHDNTLPHFYLKLFRSGELLLPVSHFFRDILIRGGAAPESVRVHRMGVDINAIRFRERFRSDRPLNVVSVCRLVEKKGLRYAIAALGALRARCPYLAWRWEIIGDGPLRAAHEEQVRACGIHDRVEFLGFLTHEEAKRRVGDADVFLLPSITASNGDLEGVPVSVSEAMASGAVVVSSEHAGIPELVESGVSGLLAPERDVETLSLHLQWIAENPHGAAAMAKAARSAIERNFDRDKLHDALATLLTDTVAATARA
jgi:colanic acid/amylovoran biosynthesis glycosyltransferase